MSSSTSLSLLAWLLCMSLLLQEANSSFSSATTQISLFDLMDTNKDGKIDADEYNAGMQKLQGALQGTVPPVMSAADTHHYYFSEMMLRLLPTTGHSTSDGFWKAFTSSVCMILATEIGDKTFFIAAVLSMRFDRSAVFGGAIGALILMTILSTLLGQVLPTFVPRAYTHILGGLLFLYFGAKLVYESKAMTHHVSEELEEVEEELQYHPKKRGDDGDDNDKQQRQQQQQQQQLDEESGGGGGGGGGGTSKMKKRSSSVMRHHKSWHAVAWQSLTLTFLAEWGDRSQIATIALAAAKNPMGVVVGGCLGHAMCTGLATIGGRMLAARISEKTVAFYGGIVFLLFGVHSLFFEE